MGQLIDDVTRLAVILTPCTVINAKTLICQADLIKLRGWKDRDQIESLLGVPDATGANVRHEYGPPLRLYAGPRVLRAECSDVFRKARRKRLAKLWRRIVKLNRYLGRTDRALLQDCLDVSPMLGRHVAKFIGHAVELGACSSPSENSSTNGLISIASAL